MSCFTLVPLIQIRYESVFFVCVCLHLARDFIVFRKNKIQNQIARDTNEKREETKKKNTNETKVQSHDGFEIDSVMRKLLTQYEAEAQHK